MDKKSLTEVAAPTKPDGHCRRDLRGRDGTGEGIKLVPTHVEVINQHPGTQTTCALALCVINRLFELIWDEVNASRAQDDKKHLPVGAPTGECTLEKRNSNLYPFPPASRIAKQQQFGQAVDQNSSCRRLFLSARGSKSSKMSLMSLIGVLSTYPDFVWRAAWPSPGAMETPHFPSPCRLDGFANPNVEILSSRSLWALLILKSEIFSFLYKTNHQFRLFEYDILAVLWHRLMLWIVQKGMRANSSFIHLSSAFHSSIHPSIFFRSSFLLRMAWVVIYSGDLGANFKEALEDKKFDISIRLG